MSDQVVITMDWAATLLAAVGVAQDASSPMDGIDVLPMITGAQPAVERKLFWRYKFNAQQAMRDGRYKYLKIKDNTFLFDVVDDPQEKANLKARYPDVYSRMTAEYERWNATMLPQIPESASSPAGFSDNFPDRFSIERPRPVGGAKPVAAPKPADE